MLNLLASRIRVDAMSRKASRPGCAQYKANSARYSGFKSARFPQGTKQGSGITDNCHCRTSELLIVTAARAVGRIGLGHNGLGHAGLRHARRKWRSAHRTASAADARNERTVPRARLAHSAISAWCCARNNNAAAPGRRYSECTEITAGRAPSAWLARRRLKEKERGRRAGQAAKLIEDRQLLLSKASAPFVKTGEF
ncbi:hypothetical protein ACFSHT_34420 [Paraburkholderia silviterrae]|uniref:Uncharacterized protein n=1 Tax=Paraburkholderia silviterrae TaxID=2528715 RepID=A0A4R5M745_9BURK|nr:hypothetical protein [Paraburkholderia silviterrae]TDG21497.1 hypothetical protein EYW47_21750 [Paraburkholderia silviterrae]